LSGIVRKKCCCTSKLYMQWRRCDTNGLAPLWSEPSWPVDVPEGTWPQYMWFAGDNKCYYRDGSEPTSTNPTGQIIYVLNTPFPAGAPEPTPAQLADVFAIHPVGLDCSWVLCVPTPCFQCTGPTPQALLVIFDGIAIEEGCVREGSGCCAVTDPPSDGYFQSLTSAAALNRAFLVPVRSGCSWGLDQRRIAFNRNTDMCDGCTYPTPGCEDAPFPLFYDPGGEFDIPVNFSVAVGRFGTGWSVGLSQGYSGGFAARFFDGEGSGPNPERCDEPVDRHQLLHGLLRLLRRRRLVQDHPDGGGRLNLPAMPTPCHSCPMRRTNSRRPDHCAVSGRFCVTHGRADHCPHPDGPRFGSSTPPAGWQVPPGQEPHTAGIHDWTAVARLLWGQLHRAALAADAAAFARYVRIEFTPQVICGPCKVRWQAILERMPPEEAADAFAWSVDAHNAVNVELDPPKPAVSLEEARRLHEPTEGAEGDDRTAVEARSIDN
jgi:hypothetical protein